MHVMTGRNSFQNLADLFVQSLGPLMVCHELKSFQNRSLETHLPTSCVNRCCEKKFQLICHARYRILIF